MSKSLAFGASTRRHEPTCDRATAYAAQTDRLPHKIVLIAVVTMTIAG
jgi:hypothetical protein